MSLTDLPAVASLCDTLRQRVSQLPHELGELESLLGRATAEANALMRQRRMRLERRADLLQREMLESSDLTAILRCPPASLIPRGTGSALEVSRGNDGREATRAPGSITVERRIYAATCSRGPPGFHRAPSQLPDAGRIPTH